MKNGTGTETHEPLATLGTALPRIFRFAAMTGRLTVWLALITFVPHGSSQRITDTSNGTLAATLPFGTLTADSSNTPSSVTVQFRIRNNNVAGYHVKVSSASFTPTLTAAADGGDTIAASDIGVGIVSVTEAPGFTGVLPRSDTITAGFDYDPSTVTGTNGLTPYGGLSGTPARATLQDLISTPNTKILSGNEIHASSQSAGGATNYLTVTMTFAVIRQYFTPATFSGVINLVIGNGP